MIHQIEAAFVGYGYGINDSKRRYSLEYHLKMVISSLHPISHLHFSKENNSNVGCGDRFVCCERLELGSFTPEDVTNSDFVSP
jgi:hypothetical protein